MGNGVTKLGLRYRSMAEVDDDDAWQEPKSTRQIGGNTVDKEREELDEENLYRSCVNLTNAGSDEENERKGWGSGGRQEERRRRKIEEDHEDGCIGGETQEVRKELRRG